VTPSIDVHALLVDNDGVLVDSEGPVHDAWSAWATHYGMDAGEVLERIHGRRTAESVAELLPGGDHDGALVLIDGLEMDAVGRTLPLPGSADLLAELVRIGAAWAVVTSGTIPLARARLVAAGLPLPPVMVTGDDVPRGKPAPDPYLEAAARLGVDPGDCVVFEDSPAGVAAALAAGVAAVVGVNLRDPGVDAWARVPDLSSVTVTTIDGGVRVTVTSGE
jgi:mannitol-1-/sugar-/sorbitol-6-phosphatase